MGYLKINVSLISALIERWRPETHTFHMRCGECTITLQDVSVLLGISVDGLPLIGPTNLDWTDLCEELLEVRPQEGSVVKLSWLAHHFAQINNDDDEEQVRRFARAWILRFIGGVLFIDKSSNKVSLRQFGMQQPIPESPSQPLNIHGITLKGKHDENWGQLFAPMIHQWNNRHAFRVDAYPRQEGLLSFNSDYMVWYRRKTKMFVDPQNANTATLAEVAETL
ncbi:Serine/threonine-protein phosphatase 7 long form [Glycine max]|nr:Serine/threonine-protein phosphatase 7 long form [Glycine max]